VLHLRWLTTLNWKASGSCIAKATRPGKLTISTTLQCRHVGTLCFACQRVTCIAYIGHLLLVDQGRAVEEGVLHLRWLTTLNWKASGSCIAKQAVVLAISTT